MNRLIIEPVEVTVKHLFTSTLCTTTIKFAYLLGVAAIEQLFSRPRGAVPYRVSHVSRVSHMARMLVLWC
jgi:hypothetical protein